MSDRNRPFSVHRIRDMVCDPASESTQDDFGRWVSAVPLPYLGGSIRAAWWVLTGRAHAIIWPKPGEIERAMGTYKAVKEKSDG